jgi:HD-GYP domain-containing protein (c-di-GMP phosphodiesterase class II)
MVSLADRALYTAKEMGRDRAVQAHDLNGLTWPASAENNHAVEALQNRVAGLDCQVREFFIRAVEEMVCLLRERDPDMADHAHRVRHVATLLGQEMGLPDRILQRLQTAAMLHDIGMVAMPDTILLAPGPLNEQQLQVMHRHPLLSVRIMERVEFLDQEIPSVRYHHERFDGKGYPEGLQGLEIPLTARILAVADAYVAMTSPRSFRGAKAPAEALEEVRRSSATQFDPVIVEAMLAVAQKQPAELGMSAMNAHDASILQ